MEATMLRVMKIFVLFVLLTSIGENRSQLIINPNKVTDPGKIWLQDSTLFVNDRYRGVHIFDISDPANTKRLSFIRITNNVDIAVKNNALYADSMGGLMIYNISQLTNPKLVRSIPNTCSYFQNYSGGSTIEGDKTFSCHGCITEKQPDSYTALPGSGSGGSMARFTIIGDFLYTLRFSQIKVFSITNPLNPDQVGDVWTRWDIETIFPVPDRELLFLGGSSGIYAYSITNRIMPLQIGQLTHARSYDPVVVQSNYAYVTLREGNFSEGPSSRFEIVDITDITNMVVKKVIGMDAPYGLAVQGDYAYVCDGFDGLEVFNVADPVNASKITSLQGYNGYDVILSGNLLILTGNDGIILYNISNPIDPVMIAKLE